MISKSLRFRTAEAAESEIEKRWSIGFSRKDVFNGLPESGYSAKPNPFGLPVSRSYTRRKETTLPALLKISIICSSVRPM
jgi:hypothetical protein